MEYYIEENKTFSSIAGIKHAKIEITFSDNTKVIYDVPTDNGILTIKGSNIIEENNLHFKRQIRIYEKAILNLPFITNDKGSAYTVEKI